MYDARSDARGKSRDIAKIRHLRPPPVRTTFRAAKPPLGGRAHGGFPHPAQIMSANDE